jgi:hypothetical protein
MRREVFLFFCAALFFGVSAIPAVADNRVALVIGNGAYSNVPHLPNPLHDAEDVATALKRSGFETMLASDLDKTAMDEAMIKFCPGGTHRRRGDVLL